MTNRKKKIRAIPKKEKDKSKAIILEIIINSWIEENPGFLEDVERLATEVALFNLKWGTKITGKSIGEKLFYDKKTKNN